MSVNAVDVARSAEAMPKWAWGLVGTYGPKLREVEHTTRGQLHAAMQHLSPNLRESLAEGPAHGRFDCAICEAFGDTLVGELAEAQDASDPRYLVFAYHEIPKCWCLSKEDQWYGSIANDIYERCLATYRAAGWTGTASKANA